MGIIAKKHYPGDENPVWWIKTAPTLEPVTVSELKTFARIDNDSEDTLLGQFITAARVGAERYLGRALIEQSIIYSLDYWPANRISLPRPPLISVTEVRTLDEDDTETVYASSNYYKILESAELVIRQSATQPENTSRDVGGFQIEYKAGYGDEASDVPEGIRQAISLWAASIYETRIVSEKPPPEAVPLLQPYRIMPI